MATKKKTTTQWVEECRAIHGNLYSYEFSEYTGASQPITITCSKHGNVVSNTTSHRKGAGCKLCGHEKDSVTRSDSLEDFISKASERHSNKYDYSLVLEGTDKDKATIICPCHGPFSMTRNNHKFGQGCRECAKSGFKKGCDADLYILQTENITKIGITNRNLNFRIKQINKASGLHFSARYSKVFTGSTAFALEQELLLKLRKSYEGLDKKFEGYSECFINVPEHYILEIIERINYG